MINDNIINEFKANFRGEIVGQSDTEYQEAKKSL